MKRWTIYCHTHIESGRRYIGLTSQTMEKRWKNHINVARNSKGGRWHFPNAIRKYGKDAFSHEVLEIYHDLESANLAEEWWIRWFKTRDPKLGFNLMEGGKHTPHPIYKNPWNDPEYRKKNLSKFVAAGQTPEARAKSKAALNTPESRARRSTATKEAMARPETIAKRRQFQEDPEYRAKISSSLKSALASSEARARMSVAYAVSSTPEVRVKRAAAIKRALSDPEVRARMLIASKAALSRPEIKEKLVEKNKRMWSRPEYRERMSRIMRGKGHKPEAIERMKEIYAEKHKNDKKDPCLTSKIGSLIYVYPDGARNEIRAALNVSEYDLTRTALNIGCHFLVLRKWVNKLDMWDEINRKCTEIGCRLWQRPKAV